MNEKIYILIIPVKRFILDIAGTGSELRLILLYRFLLRDVDQFCTSTRRTLIPRPGGKNRVVG